MKKLILAAIFMASFSAAGAAGVKPVEVVEYPEKYVLEPAARKAAAAKPSPSKKVPAPSAAGAGGFTVGKKHLVSDGDTLWDLSGKYYKDPYKWGKIYNANLGVVENPDWIYPKEELIIPDITEEVKPGIKKEAVEAAAPEEDVSAGDTDYDIPEEAPRPVIIAPAQSVNAMNADMKVYENNELSSEMPVDQKEWSSFNKVVPDSWREDGVISAKEKTSKDSVAEGLAFSGGIMIINMFSPNAVRKGDYLSVYRKGVAAHDKRGQRIGREIQPAGMLEVLSVEGRRVRARIVDASSTITKGLIVKVSVRR
ncbi:MAG: hypothetical protein COT18_10650 [Elusimicrobia bacterium CG08_land_8_20_14_0_20_59_10]|nr:MAG: hypothetical protein COT18_10650 [Elusimicrobia bacterium CG08_land_8_20_14_0_20_59_10]